MTPSPSTLTAHIVNSMSMPMMYTRVQFAEAMKFGHCLMRASVPLLKLAIEKSSGPLRDYYVGHLEEEKDHADWLAEDMAILGLTPPVVDHAAASIAGAQYYYLHHVGPHPLLGYMAALEFRPVPMTDVEALEKEFGAPAIRTVRHHAEHDPEHAKELARVIDTHGEFAELIAYNAFVTTKMLAFYLNERMRP